MFMICLYLLNFFLTIWYYDLSSCQSSAWSTHHYFSSSTNLAVYWEQERWRGPGLALPIRSRKWGVRGRSAMFELFHWALWPWKTRTSQCLNLFSLSIMQGSQPFPPSLNHKKEEENENKNKKTLMTWLWKQSKIIYVENTLVFKMCFLKFQGN